MTGDFIKKWAAQNKYTARDIADKLGVSRATIYKMWGQARVETRYELALAHIGCYESKKGKTNE